VEVKCEGEEKLRKERHFCLWRNDGGMIYVPVYSAVTCK
jgi:hypothetical protein